MPGDERIDPFDPRFEDRGDERDDLDRRRALVESQGPGRSEGSPRVRVLRVAIPLLALAGVGAIVAVFMSGLSPGGSDVVVGPVEAVRDAVAERPRRVCYGGSNPCAWLTLVDGDLVAFNTNGPLAEEYGRQGVGWCPTSGWFGANSTGSRWDQQGRIAEGPAPRSLDRFATTTDAEGRLVIDFAALDAGLAEWQLDAADLTPPDGAPCAEIPFDRDPDLDLGAAAPSSEGP